MARHRVEELPILVRLRRELAARRRVDRLDEVARAAWGAAQLDRLRRHATTYSPWYAERHRGLEAAPLGELPVVSKADVVEHFDDLVTDRHLRLTHLRDVVAGPSAGRALRRYRVGASSGSSGRPGLFPFDRGEWVGLLAAAARARVIPGRPTVDGPVRTARIGSPSPWHLSRQVAATLHDPRKPSLTLSAATDVHELGAALAQWQPHVLTGYPTVVGALAERQRAGDLAIQPMQVLTGGERLTPAIRERIEDAWAAPVFDQYLTTEAGFVAIECPAHDGLHVLDDHVLVEVVDDGGRPVPAGDEGSRVLLTVLGSRTLPLIRYELEDVAAVAPGRCPCGRRSPRLRAVAGAPRRLLRLPGRDGGEVSVHPVVLTAVLDASAVAGWQVVQRSAGGLEVFVAGPSSGAAPGDLVSALEAALRAAGVAPIPIDVTRVDSLRRSASGKAALVVVEGEEPRR